ncbi:diguanylate cyclase domain-containing protein [Solibacillus silvestris]|uniref:diguanylate cyclase n=1 Tax=Solibacillus silvestris TaxID=76853 RepID=UPI003F8001A7
MFIEMLSYFSILFTFTLLIYWPFINYFKKSAFVDRTIPYVTGLKFGITGLIITFSAFHLAHSLMVNTQFISVLFSGLLGGPFAILISGLLIGTGLFFLPNLTMVPLLLNVNFILLVLFLFFSTRKYELTSKTAFIYFWVCFTEMIITLFIGLCFHSRNFEYLLLYGAFTIFSFHFIYIVIHQVKRTNDTVQQSTHLQKIDFLTQLPNSKESEKHIQHLIRKNGIFNLMLVDIQDLKMINGQYGFSVGDLIIQQLALSLKEYADKNDAFAGRLSGEEFLIILKDVAPAIAVVEASNLIQAISKQSFDVLGNEDGDIRISVSVGISSYPDNGANINCLMKNLIMAEQHAKTNKISSYFHANNLK